MKKNTTLSVFFVYIVCQILYQFYGEGTRVWYAFNIITHIAMLGYVCSMLEKIESFGETERLLFCYAKWVSWANCVYILFCAFILKGYVILGIDEDNILRINKDTDISAVLISVTFVVFLFHQAVKNK